MANAIDSLSYNGTVYPFTLPYGSCSTAAATAAKTVTVSNFSLETGARISVKFGYANTVASPTLNVNSTGAKAIYWHGGAIPSSQYWAAGSVLEFVYNGTQWDLVGIAVDNNTNTTYSNATTGSAGLMSASDKSKLDGIATGANNYTYTLPSATSSTLGGVKIGSNITVSSGVISLSKSNVTSALGYTPPTTNTTYSAATSSTAGLMSATDKAKLDGIATGANNYTYTLPTATSSVLGGVKVGSNITVSSGVISLTSSNVTTALGYTPMATGTTIDGGTW